MTAAVAQRAMPVQCYIFLNVGIMAYILVGHLLQNPTPLSIEPLTAQNVYPEILQLILLCHLLPFSRV